MPFAAPLSASVGSLALGLLPWLVHALDLRLGAHLVNELELRVAGDHRRDPVPNLFEFGRLAWALILELDDVPADRRLDER